MIVRLLPMVRAFGVGLCLVASAAMTPVVSADNVLTELRKLQRQDRAAHREANPDSAPQHTDDEIPPASTTGAVPEPGDLHVRVATPTTEHLSPKTGASAAILGEGSAHNVSSAGAVLDAGLPHGPALTPVVSLWPHAPPHAPTAHHTRAD